MVTTVFGDRGDSLTTKMWSKMILQESMKGSLFRKFTGPSLFSVDGYHTRAWGIMKNHHNGKVTAGFNKHQDKINYVLKKSA